MAEKRRVVCPHCDATNAVPADREPLVAKCGRCHQKLFEGAPAALDPKARFIKVDVDANPDIASEYGVQGIPALLAFKNGNVVARQAGVTDLGTMRGWAERFST